MKPILAFSGNDAYTKAIGKALEFFGASVGVHAFEEFDALRKDPDFVERVSLVILDTSAGDVAWSIVRRLKSGHETHWLPVFAVASRPRDSDRLKAVSMDVLEYLSFPLSRKEFQIRCERAIEFFHDDRNYRDGVAMLSSFRSIAENATHERDEYESLANAQERVLELGRQELIESDSIRNAQESVFELSRQELLAVNEKLHENYEAKIAAIKEKSELQMMFGKYISPEVIEVLMRQDGLAKLAGEKQDITILFADMRGFTALCDRMAPNKILLLLNEFFTELTEIILQHHGLIDKYSGDNIMAIFGAPAEMPDHASAAVLAAIEMQKRFRLLKESWSSIYHAEAGLGIGINSGQAVVGNVGCYHKISYTAIGDVVNIAARFEQLAVDRQIIIGESLRERLGGEFFAARSLRVETLEPVELRGKQGIYKIFSVEYPD